MNNSGQFSNEDDIAEVRFINQDFHQLNKKTLRNETPFG